MAEVIFADGTIFTAETWRDLEQAVRADEWNPKPKLKFRLEIGRRAYNWSGKVVDLEAGSRRLFQQLERAGMLRIVSD